MNKLYEDIREWLRDLQASGVTQDEISKSSGVARSYICRIMNQPPEKLKGLSLEVFFKLFPNARVELGTQGTHTMGNVTNNKGQVVNGDVHGSVVSSGSETAASFLKRIMESGDFDSDTKVKLFNLLNRRQ